MLPSPTHLSWSSIVGTTLNLENTVINLAVALIATCVSFSTVGGCPLSCDFTSAAGNLCFCVSPGFVPRLSREFAGHLLSLFFSFTWSDKCLLLVTVCATMPSSLTCHRPLSIPLKYTSLPVGHFRHSLQVLILSLKLFIHSGL